MADYDSPWKEALVLYFREFLAFFFPAIHDAVDWSSGSESLDKELRQVIRAAETGRLYVDHLVRVLLRNGQEEWLLIHVEVQAQTDAEFTRRMYDYNSRIRDRYGRDVISVAVLADDSETWRPDHHEFALLGFRTRMDFPTAKVLDIVRKHPDLETTANPFAVLALAHVRSQETRHDPEARRAWKFSLVRSLYERGMSADDVRELYRCIDWMMDLPKALESAFLEDVANFEKEKQMPFVDSATRKGMEIGIDKGTRGTLVEVILLDWERFGDVPEEYKNELANITDADLLRKILRAGKTAGSLDELRPLWKTV